MKLIGAAFCAAVLFGAGFQARASEQTRRSQIGLSESSDISVTGCVRPTASGTSYMLTNVADRNGVSHAYMLLTEDVDVSQHVGQRVAIVGSAADRHLPFLGVKSLRVLSRSCP